MKKLLASTALLATLAASPALAWTKPVVIENYLYAPQVILTLETSNNDGQTWSYPIQVNLAGWHPPNGAVPKKTIRIPSDAPCMKLLRFTFQGHIPVTWPYPFNVCSQTTIELKQATPSGGPTAPIQVVFE